MKKTLSLILSLFMVFTAFSAMPVSAYAESDASTTGNGTESDPWIVHSWAALKEKMALGGYIRLGEDVTDPDHTRETYLYVPADRMVDLELNGFAVNRNLGTTQIRDGSVIQVDGILNLRDSSAEKTGKITGGYSSSYTEYGDRHTGGGIFVNGGTLNMYSGSVCNNRATDGGGIYARKGTVNIYGGSVCNNITDNQAAGIYLQTSSLYMQDGLISNNETTGCGGGVYLYLKSTFVMDGGTISENTCGEGGGVYLHGELGIETNPSSFTMNGGSITKNTVEESDYYSGHGGGVYAGPSSTFNLYGGSITENKSTYWRSPKSYTMERGAGVYFITNGFSIKGNPAVTGNVSVNRNGGKTIPGNIYVPRNQRINVADALEEGASFGLICQDYEAEVTSGFKTYNSEDEPTAFFTSDIAEYKVIKNDSGEAEIKEKVILDGNVTPENIFDYFDASGNLTYTEAEELVFKGDFSSVSLPLITIGSTVKLTSDNAVFSGTSFLITADDVTLDGFDITVTGEYAIKVDRADGTAIVNNTVKFTSNNNTGTVRRALVAAGTDADRIESIAVQNNTFDISLISEQLQWTEDPPGSGLYIQTAMSAGIEFSYCDSVSFASNTAEIGCAGVDGFYDTIYGITVNHGLSDTSGFNASDNVITVTGNTYAYAVDISSKKYVLTDNFITCTADKCAEALTINLDWEGTNGICQKNTLNAEGGVCAYGIYYSDYNSGAACTASSTAASNIINLKGKLCFGARFHGSFQKPKTSFTLVGNTITEEGSYLYGAALLMADSTSFISNTIDARGTNDADTDSLWESAAAIVDKSFTSCGIYNNNSKGVIANNIVLSSDYGIASFGGCTVVSNTVATDGEYAVDTDDSDASVMGNKLNAKTRYGDGAVNYISGEVHDNDHEHNYAAGAWVAPNCTEKGYIPHTCTYCGDMYPTDEADAIGHDFGDNEAVCRRCGAANPDYKEIISPEDAALPTEEKTEEEIKKTNTDKKDVAGSDYQRLMLKATPKGKTITLKWKAINGANGYIIYGAPCGQKMTRLATVTNPKTVKKTFKKLKKGKYYKYMVVAYKKAGDGSNRVISKSKSVHCTTPGGKKGNPTGLKAPKALTVKKGKKAKIKAKLLTKGKVATHIAKFRYETSNKAIATVDAKGYIKGKKKGTVIIYVYTQNGICKTIKVKVK